MRAMMAGLLAWGGLCGVPALAAENEMARASELANRSLLLDYAALGGRLVAVGEFGNIIYSDDAGRAWQQANAVASRTTLTAVTFVNAQLGFAVGHDTAILRTKDSGENWELIYKDESGEVPLFGVLFLDEQRGLAVGAFGTLLRTANGGTTWDVELIDAEGENDYHLNAIFSAPDGTIYVPAEAGSVYKSTDGGETFRLLNTNYEGSFWNGMVLASGRVLIWGMRGNVYYSDTQGQVWTKAETGTDRSVMGGLQLPDGRIVLTGLSGTILASTDDGKTFQETVRSDRSSFAAVSRGADGRLILYGDPGVSWQDLP